MMYFIPALLSVLTIYALIPFASRVGLVDRPDHRKSHVGEIPLVGGIGIMTAFAVTVFVFGQQSSSFLHLELPLGFLMLVSLADDKLQLSARFRLLIQVLAASYLWFFGDTRIVELGNLFGQGDIRLGLSGSYFMTVFGTVGLINALNMADGLDGLAGGLSLVSLVFFAFTAHKSGLDRQANLNILMASAVSGFLLLNMRTPWRKKARIFMGDAGSMTLGLFLAWSAIRLSSPAEHAIEPISALWIMAIPVIDTLGVMTRRIIKGRHPFAPDQEHLHHILLRAGFSVQNTVYAIIACGILLGWCGLMGIHVGIPSWIMTFFFVLLLVLHGVLTHYAWRIMKWLKSVRGDNLRHLQEVKVTEKIH